MTYISPQKVHALWDWFRAGNRTLPFEDALAAAKPYLETLRPGLERESREWGNDEGSVLYFKFGEVFPLRLCLVGERWSGPEFWCSLEVMTASQMRRTHKCIPLAVLPVDLRDWECVGIGSPMSDYFSSAVTWIEYAATDFSYYDLAARMHGYEVDGDGNYWREPDAADWFRENDLPRLRHAADRYVYWWCTMWAWCPCLETGDGTGCWDNMFPDYASMEAAVRAEGLMPPDGLVAGRDFCVGHFCPDDTLWPED